MSRYFYSRVEKIEEKNEMREKNESKNDSRKLPNKLWCDVNNFPHFRGFDRSFELSLLRISNS